MNLMAKIPVAVLVAFGFIAEAASAQTEPAQAPRAKVGFVNYGAIFTKYEKAAHCKKEMEDSLRPFQAEADGIKIEATRLKRVAEAATTSPEDAAHARDHFSKQLRRLEEIDKIAKEKIGKVQEANLVALWGDIKDAVAKHAKSKDLDIVFAHVDGVHDADDFTNINRKMTGLDTGGAIPVYIRPGVDITNDVLMQLNKSYRKQKQATSAQSDSPK